MTIKDLHERTTSHKADRLHTPYDSAGNTHTPFPCPAWCVSASCLARHQSRACLRVMTADSYLEVDGGREGRGHVSLATRVRDFLSEGIGGRSKLGDV